MNNVFKPSIKDVFITIERLRKIFTQSVCILCRNRENLCSCYFLCLSQSVAASANISYFFMNVRLLLKDIIVRLPLKENVQLIFFMCVAASKCISMFFNESATASEKILKEKCEAAF